MASLPAESFGEAIARIRAETRGLPAARKMEAVFQLIKHLPEEWQGVAYSLFDFGLEIGTREDARMRQESSTVRLIVVLGFLFGLALLGTGVWLTFLRAEGASEISLMGLSVNSTTVGVPAMALGSLVVLGTFNRVLKLLTGGQK